MPRPVGKDVEDVIEKLIGSKHQEPNTNNLLFCLIADSKKDIFSMFINGSNEDVFNLFIEALNHLAEDKNPALESVIMAVESFKESQEEDKIRLN